MSNTTFRFPARSAHVWTEVRTSILIRLADRSNEPMDEIAIGRVLEELLRIAMHHIHVDGYPEPGHGRDRVAPAPPYGSQRAR